MDVEGMGHLRISITFGHCQQVRYVIGDLKAYNGSGVDVQGTPCTPGSCGTGNHLKISKCL